MKLSGVLLIIGAILMGGLTVLLIQSQEAVLHPDTEFMATLSQKSEQAFKVIKNEKETLGLTSSHYSGMIGPDFSGITTTLGSLESKTTSSNPNFSGAIHLYLKKARLAPGDKVALNLSGSFPALNIQAIIAVESMGLIPVISSSLGASTYGATDPELTYPDMEYILYESALILHKSQIISPGGDDDLGGNMDPALLAEIVDRFESRGMAIYFEEDFDRNLQTRLDLYDDCKLLINVGGNYVSRFGEALEGHRNGYLQSSKIYNYQNRGLIGSFLSEGRDVIHLIDIKTLALEFGFPIDPQEPGASSGGSVYHSHFRYNSWYLYAIMTLFILVVFGYFYVEKKALNKDLDQIIQEKFMD